MRCKLNYSQICVTVLISIEIVAGLIVLGTTAYFHHIFTAYLPKPELKLLFSQMTNIYILGFELLICCSLGLALWHHCCKNNKITQHSKLLILWKSFSALAVMCGSVTIWFQHSYFESLEIAYKASLFQGIDLYFTDPEWKILWDKIQIQNECCGVLGFEDWQDAAWNSEQNYFQEMPDSTSSIVVIPFACCKRTATSCFESFAPHEANVKDLYIDINEITPGGCLAVFNRIKLLFCYVLSSTWLFCLITELILLAVFICVILRLKDIASTSQLKDDSDERPLVVLKCPRNVRCVTLKDEDMFVDEHEYEETLNQKFSNSIIGGQSICQNFVSTCSANENIFLH